MRAGGKGRQGGGVTTKNSFPGLNHPRTGERAWCFFAEHPAPALSLEDPEGCATLRFVLATVPPVSRFCEHLLYGFELHLLRQGRGRVRGGRREGGSGLLCGLFLVPSFQILDEEWFPRAKPPADRAEERLVFYCQTTSVSTAPCPTHRASYCAPCQPLLRAFP